MTSCLKNDCSNPGRSILLKFSQIVEKQEIKGRIMISNKQNVENESTPPEY